MSYADILANSAIIREDRNPRLARIYLGIGPDESPDYAIYKFTVNQDLSIKAVRSPLTGRMIDYNGLTAKRIFSVLPYSQYKDIVEELWREARERLLRAREKEAERWAAFETMQRAFIPQKLERETVYLILCLLYRKRIPQVLSRKIFDFASNHYKLCGHSFCDLTLACCICDDKRKRIDGLVQSVEYVDGKGLEKQEIAYNKYYCVGCKEHSSSL